MRLGFFQRYAQFSKFPFRSLRPSCPLAPAFWPEIFSRHALIKGEGYVVSQSFITDYEKELKYVNRVSLVKPTSSGKLCFNKTLSFIYCFSLLLPPLFPLYFILLPLTFLGKHVRTVRTEVTPLSM